MLTPLEKIKQAKELQCVLKMNGEDPANCWKVRDYLEDKLTEKDVLVYPFSKMADHSANKWFTYDTPWRNK